MDVERRLGGLWRRFRSLAGWVQLTIAVTAGLVLLSPFTSGAGQTVQGGDAPAAARGAAPTTVVAVSTTLAAPGVPAGGDDTTVTRVIDGDTIVVAGGVHVRLIGVDTPETVDPSSPVQCFGPEASRYMNELLPVGTPVRLVYDVERLDRYGRTLAYVYKLTDGVFVNLAVVRNGFASQLTVPPNVAHAEDFRVAVAQARVADLGLWRACAPSAPATTTTVPTTVAVATTRATVGPAPATTMTTVAAAAGCHPSYAGACVPTGFSDVDCAGGGGNGPGYVSAKNFQVVGPDVYGLDSDHNGIACEST